MLFSYNHLPIPGVSYHCEWLRGLSATYQLAQMGSQCYFREVFCNDYRPQREDKQEEAGLGRG